MLQDARYALRLMGKTPLFTATVIATIALAIAANTAIFSVVNAVMLRPLPFAEPDRLVQVAERNDKLNLPVFASSVLNFLSWREQARGIEMSAVGFSTVTLSGGGDPEQLPGNTISPALLRLLGVRPVAGRAFSDEEEKPNAPPVAMVGEGLWNRRFGRDRSLVGRTVSLNGIPTTVVGIAPASLALLSGGEVFTPLILDPAKELRLAHLIFTVGRLKQGVTLAQAQAEMDQVAASVGRQYPEVRDWGINLVTFYDTFIGTQLRTALWMLLGAVVFVLLIACANIANLLLARSVTRRTELAVRSALGAGRGRLMRQLLVESAVLAVMGGGAGILGAFWAVRAIRRSLPANLLPVSDINVDLPVLAFAAGLTLLTGLLFSLAPAWRALGANLGDALKQGGRGSGSEPRARLRKGLAAVELALATILLIGAGLLIQSLANLQRVAVGFDPHALLTFQLAPPPSKYPLADKAPLFYRALVDELRALPGVKDAAVSSGIPFGAGNNARHPMLASGPSALPPETLVPIDWRSVTPGYFKAMGIPLLRGRDFTDADGPASHVTIVSEATAKKFWGDADPLGHALIRSADRATAFTVIGVVGDVRILTLNQELPSLYYPIAARVWPLMDVAVRVDGEPGKLLPSIRRKVREIDPELALANVRTMDEWIAASSAQLRLSTQLLSGFAAAALLIAALGIYGVLASSVSQRTREIGMRMALGAQPGGVLRLVVGEGMRVALAGISAGLLGGLALGQVVSSLVYGIAVRDPATFAAVAVALGGVAVAACVLPAVRAARVDPMAALRCE
ncbi:MAG TPA: ABC transporter permease [Candidatus Polarisedimenticolia bacterium]|nr:ABC transporter permease [Candidatus Polarisedimenticolia bacterium]